MARVTPGPFQLCIDRRTHTRTPSHPAQCNAFKRPECCRRCHCCCTSPASSCPPIGRNGRGRHEPPKRPRHPLRRLLPRMAALPQPTCDNCIDASAQRLRIANGSDRPNRRRQTTSTELWALGPGQSDTTCDGQMQPCNLELLNTGERIYEALHPPDRGDRLSPAPRTPQEDQKVLRSDLCGMSEKMFRVTVGALQYPRTLMIHQC